jgi:NAD(P)-dependent dehydrogenase (short-subunit alcohol dehydrogenase family)
MFDLSDRVALVTGAGQNVGSGIARLLAAQGAAVAVNDVVAERAEATVAEIEAAGGRAIAAPFDVTEYDAVVGAVDEIVASLGPIDILVNNAGNGGARTMAMRAFRDSDPARWDGPIRVNLYGAMYCSRAVINGMCERGWGRIVTISSLAGTRGVALGLTPYSAGKGGGISFMRSLALEVAGSGVTANTIALGFMGVPDAELSAQLGREIPVGRQGTPEDVGAACVWLVSDEGGWVTGQTIEMNGGVATS